MTGRPTAPERIDRKRRALAFALPASLASAALALPCQAQTLATRTIIDDRGATLTFDDVPRRIATISYFGADTALALGVRPIASTFLARGRRPAYLRGQLDDALDIGQRANANLELLAKARPDLIVAMRRYTEANALKLAQIGPYVALDLETLDDGTRGIALIGAALDRAGDAARLNARFAELLADCRARAPKRRKPPRYAFVWGAGSAPWAFYDESATCSLLNRLGGVNVAGRNPWPEQRGNTAFQMSLEALLRAEPETIFIYDDGPRGAFEANPAWRYLTAKRRARIVLVDDHWIESCGPIARHAVLAEGAAHLYPETFAPPNLRAIASGYLR